MGLIHKLIQVFLPSSSITVTRVTNIILFDLLSCYVGLVTIKGKFIVIRISREAILFLSVVAKFAIRLTWLLSRIISAQSLVFNDANSALQARVILLCCCDQLICILVCNKILLF